MFRSYGSDEYMKSHTYILLFCHIRGDAALQLGQGLWKAVHNVRGQTTRIIGAITKFPSSQGFRSKAAHERPMGTLDMPEILFFIL